MEEAKEKIKELMMDLSIFKNEEIDNLFKLGSVFVIIQNEYIEEEMGGIFSFVNVSFPKHLQNTILYLLSELTDNITQHSEFKKGIIFLNYDYIKKETVMTVFDDGISIPGGFKRNRISFGDDSEAIKMALKGKSTKDEKGRGFGLSTSQRLVEKGFSGEFLIVSGKGFYDSRNLNLISKKEVKGTLLSIRFFDKGEDLNIYPYIA